MISYKFIISGKVQGVYYRKTIASNAKKYHGYVKNLKNGDVEAAITCNKNTLDDFIEILKKGSSNSIVKNIDIKSCDEIFSNGFQIRY